MLNIQNGKCFTIKVVINNTYLNMKLADVF